VDLIDFSSIYATVLGHITSRLQIDRLRTLKNRIGSDEMGRQSPVYEFVREPAWVGETASCHPPGGVTFAIVSAGTPSIGPHVPGW
jgi:hypothetical protein